MLKAGFLRVDVFLVQASSLYSVPKHLLVSGELLDII